MALEGKFSESGLQSMDDGADVLTTLARELVMNQGVGQSADDVWKALQAQQPQTQMAAIAPEPEPLPAAPLVSSATIGFHPHVRSGRTTHACAAQGGCGAFCRSALSLLILAGVAQRRPP